jgi:hypothetical protein
MRNGVEHERGDTGLPAPSPTPDGTFEANLDFDSDGHGPFRDMCLVYGDINRPVFLQEIISWFVRSASKTELAALKRAMFLRSRHIISSKGGKKGRPRGRDDADWLVKVRTGTWRRIVQGFSWKRTAESEGLKPNQRNIRTIERTLSRRQDQYAAVIWEASSEADVWRSAAGLESNLSRLEDAMENLKFRQWLWVKAGLFGPSSDKAWIEGCKKIVLVLAPRGGNAAGADLVRFLRYRDKKRQK